MRLTQYINESEIAETYAKIMVDRITKNCKPYLKLLKGREPIKRGMDSGDFIWSPGSTKEAGLKKVRQDRLSKAGIDQEVYRKINIWLKDHKGAQRDKSVIGVTKPGSHAFSWFGPQHWIWPTGNFKYTFVESHDFNSSSRNWELSKFTAFIKWHYPAREEMEWQTKVNGEVTKTSHYKPIDYFHINKDFDLAYNKGYEIWFECKTYYYVKVEDAIENIWQHIAKIMKFPY